MNPNSGENQPQIEFSAPEVGNKQEQSAEKAVVASPENQPQKQSVQASSQAASDLAMPAQSLSVMAPIATVQNASDTAGASSSAQDNDRIEKEWIDKAKKIIAKTLDDPFEQKNAMSQVKAEYIQKRFNKTIKVDDTKSK